VALLNLAVEYKGKMILLSAVITGLMTGLIRAIVSGRKLAPVHLRCWWLVLLAFILQGTAFSFYLTQQWIPDFVASWLLMISQTLTMIFFVANWKYPGFLVAALGVGLNLLVIAANGGFMPISPDTVGNLIPNAPIGSWQIGERLGLGKDIVLPISVTRLWFLSDCLMPPAWFPYKVAFSLGDLAMALGLAWHLGSLGSPYDPDLDIVAIYDPKLSIS
jgi:hypothetical protein